MQNIIRILVMIVFGLGIFQKYALAQNMTGNGSLTAGNAILSGSDYTMAATIGQPAIGTMSNETLRLAIGILYQSSGQIATAVEENLVLPSEFRLQQNYPNPFNPTTTIEFSVPKQSYASLKLYDITGRELATLVNDKLEPGIYKVVLNSKLLSSGVYIYRFQADKFEQVKKLTVIK